MMLCDYRLALFVPRSQDGRQGHDSGADQAEKILAAGSYELRRI